MNPPPRVTHLEVSAPMVELLLIAILVLLLVWLGMWLVRAYAPPKTTFSDKPPSWPRGGYN